MGRRGQQADDDGDEALQPPAPFRVSRIQSLGLEPQPQSRNFQQQEDHVAAAKATLDVDDTTTVFTTTTATESTFTTPSRPSTTSTAALGLAAAAGGGNANRNNSNSKQRTAAAPSMSRDDQAKQREKQARAAAMAQPPRQQQQQYSNTIRAQADNRKRKEYDTLRLASGIYHSPQGSSYPSSSPVARSPTFNTATAAAATGGLLALAPPVEPDDEDYNESTTIATNTTTSSPTSSSNTSRFRDKRKHANNDYRVYHDPQDIRPGAVRVGGRQDDETTVDDLASSHLPNSSRCGSNHVSTVDESHTLLEVDDEEVPNSTAQVQGITAELATEEVVEAFVREDDNVVCGCIDLSNKWHVVGGSLAVFVLLAGIVGVVVFFVLQNDTDEPIPSPPVVTPAPVTPTTAPVPGQGIVQEPTDFPTQAPTELARFDVLFQRMSSILAPDDPAVLLDPSTPQHWALQWMANVDQYSRLSYYSVSNATAVDQQDPTEQVLLPYLLVERYVMILLYNATNVLEDDFNNDATTTTRTWFQTFNFLSPILPTCAWKNGAGTHGVTECSNIQRITKIELPDNGLRGSIPTEIGLLKQLQHLDLQSNEIFGGLPSEIGLLTNLQWLDLQTQISYSSSFGTTTSNSQDDPQVPDLEDEDLLYGTIPTEIGLLTNLQHLDMSSSRLTGSLPTQFGNLSLLTNLDLSNNDLSGALPSELGHLSVLQVLQLHSNDLTRTIPSQLGLLGALRELQLTNNRLEGGLPSLDGFSSLQELNVASNLLSGSIPTSIGQLSALTLLRLSLNDFSGTLPTELGNLSNNLDLQLYLGRNQLGGRLPTELGRLTNVQGLDLTANQIVGSIPLQLSQLTANLRVLSLAANQLTGFLPTQLGLLSTSLQELYLGENGFSGSIPSELGRLTNLNRLFLNSNQLQGNVPSELSSLRNLARAVHLERNLLSGSLDGIFCSGGNRALQGVPPGLLPGGGASVWADCGGPFAILICSCCEVCCNNFNGVCDSANS